MRSAFAVGVLLATAALAGRAASVDQVVHANMRCDSYLDGGLYNCEPDAGALP